MNRQAASQMTVSDLTHRRLGMLGLSIFSELASAPWSKTTTKAVEESAAAVATSTGNKRSRNEDRALIAEIVSQSGERFNVALVCDGVGGSEMGDVAATLACAAFLSRLQCSFGRRPLEALLVDLIEFANQVVGEELRGKGATTMCALVAAENGDIAAANVGDSRIFSWETGENVTQVSVDDTMENEFRNLPVKDSSILDAKGLRGALSQAVGEIGQPGDRLRVATLSKHLFRAGAILATDGAWKGNESTFSATARNAGNALEAVRRISAVASWTGGIDNASIVAIDNLTTFARSGQPKSPRREAGARIWVSDYRIVIPWSRTQSFNSGTPFASDKNEPRKKAQDDRKLRRRSEYQKRPEQRPADQLNLIDDSAKDPKRPKIEISTEFESPGQLPP